MDLDRATQPGGAAPMSGSATGPLTLAPRLDLASAGALAADLEARAGADLTVDAQQVRFLGALGAQVLLAARQRWERDGRVLTIAPRSDAFDAAAAVLGLSDRLAAGQLR